MLVLSRKISEVITIGNDIKVLVVAVRGDKVRIGIDAPKDVPVHREEVMLAIKQQEAAAGDPVADEGHVSDSQDGESAGSGSQVG